MKVIPTYGPRRTNWVSRAARVAAGMVTLMLLAQLYGFEDFSTVLSGVLPFDESPLISAIAASLVLLELFALPYLLSMYLSPLMRIVSAVVSAAVALTWFFVTITNAHAGNVGLFSASPEVPGGILAAGWTSLLAGLIAWVLFVDCRSYRHRAS